MLQPQALRWCSQCAPPPPPPFNSLLLKYLSKVLLQDFQIGTPKCGFMNVSREDLILSCVFSVALEMIVPPLIVEQKRS